MPQLLVTTLPRLIDQDRFGRPYGNCTQACIATIIGEPLHAVPDFNAWHGVFANWNFAAKVWLAHRGWDVSDCWNPSFAAQFILRSDEVCLAGGINPDDLPHMVVWQHGRGVIHDPNPSRRGLKGEPDFLITIRRALDKDAPS